MTAKGDGGGTTRVRGVEKGGLMGVGPMESGSAARPRVGGRSSPAQAVKRGMDAVVAALALLVLAPLLLLLAAVILVAEGRPILFRQRRVGRYGRTFTMYKFRTMVPDAHARLDEVAHANERGGPLFKATDDPRVTRVGRFLRTSSLDELPQLLNVLNGTMSLVGPRPALPEERAQFPAELLQREDVPQGLTGLWQLEGRNESDFGVYRDLDLAYVRSWSLGRDLAILVRTPFVVLRHALRRPATAPGAAAPLAGAAGDELDAGGPSGLDVVVGPHATRSIPLDPSAVPDRVCTPITALSAVRVGLDD